MEPLQKLIADNFVEIGSAIIAGAILVVLTLFKDWIRELVVGILSRIFRTRRHPACPSPQQIENDSKIRDFLSDLRIQMNADRCHVWQFHNGSVFSSQHPIFRITCSHESCRLGIAYIINDAQGWLATMMLELIGPMFGADLESGFVTKIANDMKYPLFWLDIQKMPSSFCKSKFAFVGTKYVCVAPLIYQDQNRSGEMRNKIMGFVSASFNDVRQAYPENVMLLAKCASEIAYAVNSVGSFSPLPDNACTDSKMMSVVK